MMWPPETRAERRRRKRRERRRKRRERREEVVRLKASVREMEAYLRWVRAVLDEITT